MKKIQYIIGGIVLITYPIGIKAQSQIKDSTMNRTVVVEQEYNPDISDASKVNALPKVEPLTITPKAVEYDAKLIPTSQIPFTTMGAYTGKEMQEKARLGYARLGFGNYGNMEAKANYLFLLSTKDKLDLNFLMDGMSGKLDVPTSDYKWKSHYYRTQGSIDYLHSFSKLDLNIASHFGISNFNFFPDRLVLKRQKFLSGDVHFGLKSTSDDLPFQFRAETNLLLYQRKQNLLSSDVQEKIIRTKADASSNISENQHIGLQLSVDNVFYKNNDYSNYTSIDLHPYYQYEDDYWKIRLAAHTDLSLSFGKKFYMAPDISAQYSFSDNYILYTQVTGGRLTNDFRRLERICPYGEPMSQLDATYEQVNANLGIKASPITGLWFNLYGGYQNIKNDLYQTSASLTSAPATAINILALNTANTHNAYAGIEIDYSYKKIFSLKVKGIYRDWQATKENRENILYFKPMLENNIEIDLHPTSSIQANIGYLHISREKIAGNQAKAVSNLYLGGSYKLFKGVAVYVRAANLLNKNYQYYYGYPTEGFNFIGGVNFQF